ncbi:hypothetical protein P7H41_13545 [Vagococcus fluvialis]|uniref:hypothetical protein n=1 Tax=Vagococcus fluvialis TaxID=2738 RepID=UPI00288F5638|nr:hypothetical protein [Vagococcus fluvialis]MDT2782967.1 hypothetical protein [Vagococcus fluvialis]
MSNYNIKTWVDGVTYSNIPNYLSLYFLQSSTNKKNFKLKTVGIHLHHDTLNIMLPKNTDENNFKPEEQTKLLVNSILNNKLANSASENRTTSVSSSDLFSTVLWLIRDFKKHGIYINSTTIENKTRGKYHWSKTIKKSIPFIDKESLIITEFIKKKKINEFTEISSIHISVMSYISSNYGVFFNNFNFQKKGVHIDLNVLDDNKSKYLSRILTKAIKLSNITREIQLFKKLLAFLHLIQNNNDLSVSTDNFQIIFENLFKDYIKHDESLMDFVPQANWTFTLPGDIGVRKVKNKQIPDALVSKNKNLYVYDAKYYDLSELKNKEINKSTVPLDWYSVGKQFLYAISFNFHESKLVLKENAFVFPYTLENSELTRIGEISINLPHKGQENITIYLIDTFQLIRHYLNKTE